MIYSTGEIWALIALIGAGTYLIRFSFLGIIGNRPLPAVILRLLRYTPVAVIPGLIAPGVAAPAMAGDLALPIATAMTVLIGWRTKNLVAGFLTGLAVFWGLGYLAGG